MRKTKKNRAMAVLLALVMALTTVTAAFAASAYDYYVPKETYQPSSLAELEDPELLERYNREQRTESTREDLYRCASNKLFALPTSLKPTPLPEELGLDPAAYWEQISPNGTDYDGNTRDTTTRPIGELYQEIRQLTDELTAGLTTESEKFAAIREWTSQSKNFDYSVQNRTHNVYLAYERKYGACMEQAHLEYLMATLAGLKACLVDCPTHLATAVIEEHGIWVGDDTKKTAGSPVPTEAFYIDGTTKYKMDFTTGEITNMGEINIPGAQPEPDPVEPEPTPAPVPAVTFSDVPANAWYAGAVNWAVAKGITNGTGANTFSPTRECKNVEIIVFLHRAAGKPTADAALPFTVKNAWATDALKWVYAWRIIGADFNENAPCTRYNAVNYIWKAFGSPTAGATVNFNDISGLDARPIAWAVENGIVAGTGNNKFSPNNVCDRATIVTLLQRAFSK